MEAAGIEPAQDSAPRAGLERLQERDSHAAAWDPGTRTYPRTALGGAGSVRTSGAQAAGGKATSQVRFRENRRDAIAAPPYPGRAEQKRWKPMVKPMSYIRSLLCLDRRLLSP
jgi:hypothetical protein